MTAAVVDLVTCNGVESEIVVGTEILDDNHWAAGTAIAGKPDADTQGLKHWVELPSQDRRLHE